MGGTATIGDVTARLTADTASFDAKIEKSGQVLDRHAALTEKASARARAAWEKELVAQDRAAQSLALANKLKEMAALKADILARSLEGEAMAQEHAGETAITSMQATSASLRALEGGFNNNLRSMERWVSQSALVSNAAKSMFQFVGAGTFGFLVFESAEKVVKIIEEARGVADELKKGFNDLHTEALSTNNALAITNDNLAMELARLEKKPGNGLQLALDEARQSADQLSDSLSKDIAKVDDLIAKHKVGLLGELMGQSGTSGSATLVTGIQAQIQAVKNEYQETIDHATDRGATPQNIVDIKTAELSRLEAVYATATAKIQPILHNYQESLDMFQKSGGGRGSDERGNVAILGGFMQQMEDEQKRIGQSYLSDTLRGKIAPLRAAGSGSLDAANAARTAAAARFHAMELELNEEKLIHTMSVKEAFDFWSDRIGAFTRGSEQYNQIVARQAQLAIEGAKSASETIKKFRASQAAQSAQSTLQARDQAMDRVAGLMLRGRVHGVEGQMAAQVDSNQLAIVDAHNVARAKEAMIMDEAGRSMTRYAAAVDLAEVHQKEFSATMLALEAIRSDRALAAGLDPSKENNHALAEAQAAIANANANRALQQRQDNRAMNGPDGSALVGAKDALDEFILSTRAAAQEMNEFVRNTLNSLNGELVRGMTGQRTNFSGMAVGMLSNVANIGLGKAEGSIMTALGLGGKKKPTGGADDPLHVVMGGASGKMNVVSSVASAVASKASGVAGFFGSMLKGLLPGFADGGVISPNTWAMVGEQGPEPFFSGNGGTILPHESLKSMGGSTTHVSYSIDARGTDPVQTEMRVKSAIVASHRSAIHQSLLKSREDSLRKPTRSR